MTPELTAAIFCIISATAGLLAVAAALLDWEWFFTSAGVRSLTGPLKRRAARLLYLAIGLSILAMTILVILKI